MIIEPKATTARVFTCPQEYKPEPRRISIFLAGGITGCWDWQSRVATLPIARYPWEVDFLNPRRPFFDVGNPAATVEQIEWEQKHLEKADAILFWFCAEQVQPIALFELGCYSATEKPLFIGVDDEYPRRIDVIEQMRLRRPDIKVETSGLGVLCWRIESWLSERMMRI